MAADEWLKYVEKETNGRVSITPYWGGTLISGREALAELKAGVADIAYCSVFTKDTYEITWAAGAFLLNSPNTAVTERVSREIFEKFPEYQKEFPGLVVMGYRNVYPYVLFTNKPIEKMEDIKGLTINTGTPGDVLFPPYGAEVVKIPPPEWYTSLEKGTIDAISIHIETLKAWRLAEVIDYVNVDIAAPTAGIPITFFNLDSFNSLPADIQDIFMESREYLAAEQMKNWEMNRQEGMDFGKEQGVQFINLPAEEKAKWQSTKATLGLEEAAKVDAVGKPGTEILKEAERLIELYSK